MTRGRLCTQDGDTGADADDGGAAAGAGALLPPVLLVLLLLLLLPLLLNKQEKSLGQECTSISGVGCQIGVPWSSWPGAPELWQDKDSGGNNLSSWMFLELSGTEGLLQSCSSRTRDYSTHNAPQVN
jgi:hypothetical protein